MLFADQASNLCGSICIAHLMAQGDEAVDGYVEAVIEKANDEFDLNHVKRAACHFLRGDKRRRTVFYVVECPEKDGCCPMSWKRNRPWSFDDPQRAYELCKKHLMEPELHNLSEEEADLAAQSAHVNHYTHVPVDEPRRPPRPPEARTEPRPPPTPPSMSQHRSDAAAQSQSQTRSAQSHNQSSSSRQQSQRRRNSRSRSRSRSRGKGKGKGKGKSKNDGPLTNRNNGSVGTLHGSVGATTVAARQRQIGDVTRKVAALQVADTRRNTAADMIHIENQSRTTIDVPRATAQTLNEALVRAVETSQHMRSTIESFDRAAKQNEELLARAQNILSSVLGSS